MHLAELFSGSCGLPRILKTPSATVVNPLMTLLRHSRVDVQGRLDEVLVGKAQLQRGLHDVDSTGARAECGTRYSLNSATRDAVVTMHCRECGPECDVNVVGSFDIHRDAHRRRMGHKQVLG